MCDGEAAPLNAHRLHALVGVEGAVEREQQLRLEVLRHLEGPLLWAPPIETVLEGWEGREVVAVGPEERAAGRPAAVHGTRMLAVNEIKKWSKKKKSRGNDERSMPKWMRNEFMKYMK